MSESSLNLDMTMFHQAFFEEAADLLADLEGCLLRLEETPTDLELLNTIFRCAHSIKGGSATFGFTDIAHFTHGLETLLDKVRNGQIGVDGTLTQLLLESQDQMMRLLAVARGESGAAPDGTALIARIEAATRGESSLPAIAAEAAAPTVPDASSTTDDDGWGVFGLPPSRYHLHLAPGADTLRSGADPLLLLGQLAEAGEMLSVTCDFSNLPPLAEIDPETLYLAWDIDLRSDWEPSQILEIFEFIADESVLTLEKVGEPLDAPAEPIAEIVPAVEALSAAAPPAKTEAKREAKPESAPAVRASAAAAETQTLRVATDKVDKLINLVGELVINQSMLNEVVQDFSKDFSVAKLPSLIEAVAEMERASRELQERVMAVRMLPIKHAFGRFPRLVRDLAAAVGKKIDLQMSGEDTELDKGVIEAIADPITHLVRNSVDHGLETPDERRAAGKPELGHVSLHAVHEGGSIVIEVADDGKGLNKERILQKAVERGWIAEGEMPPDETIYNYIFQPGFSTAAAVTDLSGRGVGMDIVKQGVNALGGTITLTSTPGQGTCFRIRLPLTMAILEGLSLSVGDETYILPLTSIVESIQPKAADIRRIAGRSEVVLVRGEVLPILRLYQEFDTPPRTTDPTRGLFVIVENDGRKVALLVDELIGQSQVVIKSLETNYRKVAGIAGATILGNGRVALILDVPALVRGSLGQLAYAAA